MTTFTEISKKYEKDSIVQRSASQVLFDLLSIRPKDDVLDLGCGTGHLTKEIAGKTSGKVVGVDPACGMIEQATKKYGNTNISFMLGNAEELDYQGEFDKIFCNSAFQWFNNPQKVVTACFAALRDNGAIAMQAPATDNYCPNFLKAIEQVKKEATTKTTFNSFTAPWFFLNTAKEYAALFSIAGFSVVNAFIDKVTTAHTPTEAYAIFESGAAAGYLNQQYYSELLTEEYISSFRNITRNALASQAEENGTVPLVFYRIYILAQKVTA